MQPDELRSRLGGVIAFPTTPFKPDLGLDLTGLKANLHHLLKHPVSVVVAAAGTGELFSLTPDEHRQVVETTVAEVGGRVPVLAGAGFNQPLGIQMARQAEKAGVDGILAFPPYYPQADPSGLKAYYRAIGEATSLGLIIYSRDWASFTPDQVEDLAGIPTLIAWKDGQGDLRRYQMIMNRLGDRLHWIGGVGDDLVPGYYAIGIRTYTSSIANVAPKLSLKLHETASAPDRRDELSTLMRDHVVPLYALRAKRKGYEISAMKAMMDMIGLAGGPSRPPLVEVSADERAELQAMIERCRPFL